MQSRPAPIKQEMAVQPEVEVSSFSPESDGCERFRPLVQKYDWNINIAMAVMKAESGCRVDAVGHNRNGTNDKGLFQINSIHDPTDKRLDPNYNVDLAYRVYRNRLKWDTSGWRAWSVCLTGKVICY